MNLDDKVYFMVSDRIQDGVISQVTQTRTGYIFELEYYNEESEYCTTDMPSKYLFRSVDVLLQDLKDTYLKSIGELT